MSDIILDEDENYASTYLFNVLNSRYILSNPFRSFHLESTWWHHRFALVLATELVKVKSCEISSHSEKHIHITLRPNFNGMWITKVYPMTVVDQIIKFRMIYLRTKKLSFEIYGIRIS